uniref:Kinesin motor domain-containing protein n=1 Tax=Anisakis simplex TaxID=6269 RepID=A0A0M3JKR5_ANISI
LLMKRAEEGGCRDNSDDNKENEDYFLAGGDRVGDAQNRSGIQPYSCAQQIDAMIAANDELLKLADDLNAFYGHPTNRKPICVQRV